MNVPSRLPETDPRRSSCAALLLAGFALALAGCGNSAPPPAKVPEVQIAAPPPTAAPVAIEPSPPEPEPAPASSGVSSVDKLLGRSKEHAIEVCGPPGQRAYL